MKKIGFIDLYSALDTNNHDKGDRLAYCLYIFNEISHGYELLEKVENPETEQIEELKEFYLSLPVKLLNFRILEFPFREKEKLHKVIPFELESLIIGNSNSLIYDFTVLDNIDVNNKIFVAYLEKNKLAHIIKKLSEIGIDPVAITSLELSHIIRHKKDNIAVELIRYESISEEERISSAIEELKSPMLNFRTGEFAYTKALDKYSKKIQLMLVLLISLVFVVNAIIGFRIFITNKEISHIKQQMRTLYSSLFPDDKKITDELYQMKSHMKTIREKADILVGIYALEHLQNLSNKKLKGIAIEELNLEKEIITIKGHADSMSNLDEMKKSISDLYNNVSIADIKRLSENKIMFTIIIKEKTL